MANTVEYTIRKDAGRNMVMLEHPDGVIEFGGIPAILIFANEEGSKVPKRVIDELLAREGGYDGIIRSLPGAEEQSVRIQHGDPRWSVIAHTEDEAWLAAGEAAVSRYHRDEDARSRCDRLVQAMAAKYPQAGVSLGAGERGEYVFFTQIADEMVPGKGEKHAFGVLKGEDLPAFADRAGQHLERWLRMRLGLPPLRPGVSAREAREHMGRTSVEPELPEMCFIFMEDAEPGEYVRAVRRGESGCFATTYGESDPDRARALVAHMNRKLGVSELQAECMLAGSMFGWDTPGADPDRLEKAKRNSEKGTAMSEQRERVYDFPNSGMESAGVMRARLRQEGLSPGGDDGVRDGEYRYGITLPVSEVPRLRELQTVNPARWGNHPDVSSALKAAEQQAQRDAEVNRQRLDRLNPEQQEWIEKIHYETGLYVGQALDLNDKLHDLAAKHLKLCLIDVEEGLSGEQEAARDAIESQVREICGGIKGIKEAKFLYDPRGTTVAVVFDSGAYNSFSGGWKVPVDPKYLKFLDVDAFTTEHSSARRP